MTINRRQQIARCLFLFFVWGFVQVHAHAEENRPLTIQDISFTGVESGDLTTLKQTIVSREGAIYRPDRIREDIVRLYQLGIFQDIRVEKFDAAGGVKLLYRVTEKPTVSKVEFKGNKKVKSEKLDEVSKVRFYSAFNEQQIVDTIEEIRKLYHEKGYYLAEIDYELLPYEPSDRKDKQSETKLVFHVEENHEVKIERIAFVGNRVFKDRDLKKVIKTKEKSGFSFITRSGKYDKEGLERDVMLLTLHYLKKGYLKAKVALPSLYLSRDKSGLYLSFSIEEGAQYKVSAIDVQGDILTSKAELLNLIRLQKKAIADRSVIENDVQTLSAFYGNRGYAFANVYPLIVPDDTTKTATVTYQIEKGQKIRIEKIVIKGNLVTRDKVIRRELRIKENSIFSQADLDMSRIKLEQLGLFEEINISTPRGSSDDKIIVVIDVKERKTGSFNVGGGFSTLDKFFVTASIQKQNFLGYGVSGNLSFEISSRRQQLALSFVDPYFFDTEWILSASAFRNILEYEDFTRSSLGGLLSLGHRFFNFWSFYLGYKLEDITVEDISANVPDLFDETQSGITSSLSFTVNRDTRNNRLFPTKGMFISNTYEYAGQGLGGDNDFFKEEANLRLYFPIVWKTVAKANTSFSYANSLNTNPVPLVERYFLGGPNSLRGFVPRSIGPKVRTTNSITGGDRDFVYGGNKFLLANLEYEVPIYDPAGIRAVAFVDAGNAYAEDENINFKEFRADYGAGIRWLSPFGPMRFEWGFPINAKDGEDPVVFNFTIGSTF